MKRGISCCYRVQINFERWNAHKYSPCMFHWLHFWRKHESSRSAGSRTTANFNQSGLQEREGEGEGERKGGRERKRRAEWGGIGSRHIADTKEAEKTQACYPEMNRTRKNNNRRAEGPKHCDARGRYTMDG